MPQAYEYSLAFYRRFYRPENVVLLVAGDVDPPATLRLIEKYYGPWQTGYQPPKIAPEPPQTAPRSAEIAFPGRTLPILAIAYKGDAFDPANRDYVAARLLAELAFGPQSELYKKLVLRAADGSRCSHCDIPMNRDPSLFEITAMVKKIEDVDAVREEIYRTLEEFKTKPVDRAEAGRPETPRAVRVPDGSRHAGQGGRRIWPGSWPLTGGIEAVDQLYAACDRVTPEDIMHAAAKYFVPERRTRSALDGAADDAGKATAPGHPAATPETAQGSTGILPVKEPRQETTEAHRQDAGAPAAPLWPTNAFSSRSGTIRPSRSASGSVSARGAIRRARRGPRPLPPRCSAKRRQKRNSYEQILNKLAPLAAGYSANASYEMTVISGRVHKDNLDRFCPC